MVLVDSAVSLAAIDTTAGDGERPPLTLFEWETKHLPLSEALARRLGQTKWVSVQPDVEPGWWRMSAQQWVGAFTVDDLRVIVRPKIKPENLFVLLEVGLPPEAWRQEAADYASTNELLPALVSFFARTAETTLARGLFHHYRRQEDDLLALRGRIDFVRQFRRGGVLVPMACSWDEFTADVDENRCLRTAARQALRVPGVPNEDRRRLRRVLAALDGVDEPAAPTALERLGRVQFTRLNEHYRPGLKLARLILANFTLQDRHGDTAASAFMLDMNQLFEDFVTARLQRELRGRLEVAAQRSLYLDVDRQVRIRPDLTFRRSGQTVGVADIKYKFGAAESRFDDDETAGRHGDYYQLLAYTAGLGLKEGTLIYCADANEGQSAGTESVEYLARSTITVENLGTKLHAVAIDLSGSPSDTDAQMSALADHLTGSETASAG
ncbi:McrC family protein [Candidatus Poriferisodalis sp.]|uniref:McrC family protein n=1 Tax=Candidatus Poriferisodalis sp. TaxID=3101277 RepID=UPI003D10E15D